MIALKKIWAFLKTHWYIPVIIIIAIVLKGSNASLLKIIDVQKESYEKQKEAIENAAKEKEIQKQKIEKEYSDTVVTIERTYKENNKILEERKKKEIKNIVKKYYNNPDEVAARISKSLGITYVPTESNNNPE